ncbi:hypothetical protein Arub01_37440 [Actinomadura rubrobrunea]|uniref:DUF11 domain-containing protein n=1 Tax=Actinomadura rubrobrunea TaxID=115335 RepID=A0A9W6PW37_9ACTN|nr:hypothetical protein [Actinomadura rubrobrunea]GLW65500.1 hypothetical protein Arub01_37440 [Actinomadura rubrobrunea]
MYRVIGGSRAPTRAALGAAGAVVTGVCLAAGPPAHAAARTAPPRPAVTAGGVGAKGKVEVVYARPKLAPSGTKVTWQWRLRNRTGRKAYAVVLTHRVKPPLPIRSPQKACRVVEEGLVRCTYASLRAGQTRKGTLVATLPDSLEGGVSLRGHVDWRRSKPRKKAKRPTGRPVSQGGTPTTSPSQTPTQGSGPSQEPSQGPVPAQEPSQNLPSDSSQPQTLPASAPRTGQARPRAKKSSPHGKKTPRSKTPKGKTPRTKKPRGKKPRGKASAKGAAVSRGAAVPRQHSRPRAQGSTEPRLALSSLHYKTMPYDVVSRAQDT